LVSLGSREYIEENRLDLSREEAKVNKERKESKIDDLNL